MSAWRIIIIHKVLVAILITGALLSGNHLTVSLAGWDADSYLTLSSQGYKLGAPECAFFPLWPAVIHATNICTGLSSLWAAMFLSNAFSAIAFWIFYYLVKKDYGHSTATSALILLIVFPGSLFFCFPYTESLFLLLALSFFYFLENERYFWVAITMFLMPLAKAIGVFIAIPLSWYLLRCRKPWRYWLLLPFPILGYASYFGTMYLSTGNPIEGFVAQQSCPNAPSIGNIFNAVGFLHALLNIHSFLDIRDSVLDRAVFVMFLALLPLIFRMNKVWFFYALVTGLIPALACWLSSYRRYAVICFPIFVALSQLFDRVNQRWFFWYYVIILAALQALATIQFVRLDWAG